MFREIRRKDKIWDLESMLSLLETGEYGFLAMVGINGYGYGIPINYVKAGESIYFHCAQEGYKLDCLRVNPRVSFTVVGKTQVQAEKFTTAYESVIVFGTICLDIPAEERQSALRLLVDKYAPAYKEKSEKAIAASFQRTRILRLDIQHITGKHKKP